MKYRFSLVTLLGWICAFSSILANDAELENYPESTCTQDVKCNSPLDSQTRQKGYDGKNGQPGRNGQDGGHGENGGNSDWGNGGNGGNGGDAD